MEYNLSEVKNKIVSYLVQSHIGHLFRDGTIDPQQISVNISSGDAYLRCLELDVEFLNEVGDQLNFPLRIVRGYLNELHINAPWRSFWCDGLSLATEFNGLHLTLEPKEDIDDAASMWSSAIGRLVEKSNTFKNEVENPVLLNEGAKKVDDFFRYLMSKLTVNFKDTVICFQPRNSELGVKLTIKLESLRFFDEKEASENVPEHVYDTKPRGEGSHCNSAYSTKIVDIVGASFWITDVQSEGKKDNKNEIKFAALNSSQKIKVFIKQTEKEEGPGIWVHIELGDFILFLTPRTIYLLAEFAREYSKTDDDSYPSRTKRVPKAMTDSDFQKLETVLQQQTYNPKPQYPGLQVGYGWSSVPADEEQFYSMSGNHSDGDCAMSILSNSMESTYLNTSVHSTTYSSPSTIGRVCGRGNSNYSRAMSVASSATIQRPSYDPGKEIFLIDVHMKSMAVVLLHEDILNVTEGGDKYTKDSILKLQDLSSNFLKKILEYDLSLMLQFDENSVKEILDDACQLNHIRLLCTPVHASFEVDIQKKKCEGTFKTYNMTLSECLFENKCGKSQLVPLLKFEEPLQECLCISLTKHKKYHSRSDLVISLKRCSVELDITIIDRLSALLNIPLFCKEKEPSSGMQQKHTTRFEIDIPYANFKLRFPIPDFSPLHDPKRVPWWKRNIRSDYMTLKCYQFKFQTTFSSQTKSQVEEYTFRFDVLDLFYNESAKAKPVFFAQIGDRDHKFEDCRFSIKILPTAKLFNVEEEEDPITKNTFSENFLQKKDNGPFTSKKVVHHSRAEHLDDAFPDSEFLIPGDRKEIEEFKSTSRGSAKLFISIVLSSVKMQIISKHTYEIIYNRINNDLLTWEPSAPKSSFIFKNSDGLFNECKSTARNVDSDNDSEDYSDREDYGLFQSTFDVEPEPEILDTSTPFVKKYVKQSKLVIDVKIINGTIAFNPPVRDASSNNVIPGQLGYFAIDVSEANLFMVTGYKGDSALDYVCVDVRSCDMRHHDMMPSSEVRMCLPDLRRIPSHLYPVISKSVGALVEERKSHTERPMLTVACKILTRHETHHIKTVQIALGLNKSTLHHRMTAEPNSWISQLIDFFKVTDFPISGYKSRDVLSEFHLHTWDCAIDYRPLHLPLRCAVTLGSFNMTSNVSVISNGSKLRFLAEDCDLYISQENPPKDGVASNIPIDIRREYINVMTMNMFELSLVMNDKHNKTVPHLDLRVSTDYLKIHTCSDSLKALSDLIGYIAADGDLTSNAPSEPSSTYPSPRHAPGYQELIPVDPQPLEICEVSERQRQEINSLIGQAIDEEREEKQRRSLERHQFRYFPQVERELGDFYSSDEDIENSFIIVDEDTSEGLILPSGVPEIDWMETDSVKVSDDHFFLPLTKKDLLNTPSSFPVPVTKYTLCELNIIWQLYGGKDFKKIEEKKDKKEQYLYNEAYANYFSSNESIYSKSSSSSSSYRERRNSDRESWKTSGGADRNKNVLMEVVLNKIRCQYDVYPETTNEAHRFVLQIKQFEINDKMKSSEFNKFLCQYSSELMPIQSQAYMFVVEAVNSRPPDMEGETECSLRFSLLPLRFYVDQESLEFLMKFFSEVSQKPDEEIGSDKPSSKHSTPIHQPPKLVMKNRKEKKELPKDDGDENLINLDSSLDEDRPLSPEKALPSDNYSRPLFFRPVSFGPETFIKIDYKGKYVGSSDTSVTGMLFGLIMGLAEINNSTIRLNRVCHRRGIDGIDKVLAHILQEWLNDIKKNQIQNVLISVGPMQSLVQLISGVRDLFWLPFEQYQRDGRIVKGLRKGANRFTTSTALAALELTFKFIHLLQVTAETAYDMLSSGPSVRQITNAKKRKKKYTQPQDFSEGVSNALWLVKEGIGESAETIVQVATQEHEQKGYVGMVGGIARQIPPNLVKPIIIASEAANNVLGGIRSQLVPDARIEANQKWRNTFE
ncbi:autophagy-related protein 2 homolog B [Coccinella septempunctata]|uniref:autophagy-related protein 2 homolog B n=1 Tax=Coccinella septempunctata TaxID=41139 RepID=UPI001D081DBF|nr:autophagy-related protein 2 homolog B [Coccinella septempunctata]